MKSAAPIMADRVVRSTLPDTTVRILTSFILFGEPAEAQAAINKAKSFTATWICQPREMIARKEFGNAIAIR